MGDRAGMRMNECRVLQPSKCYRQFPRGATRASEALTRLDARHPASKFRPSPVISTCRSLIQKPQNAPFRTYYTRWILARSIRPDSARSAATISRLSAPQPGRTYFVPDSAPPESASAVCGGLAGASTAITHRFFSSSAGEPGKSDAVCPSTPSPRSCRSNAGGRRSKELRSSAS